MRARLEVTVWSGGGLQTTWATPEKLEELKERDNWMDSVEHTTLQRFIVRK